MSSLARATALMTVGTVFSRLTGLLRIAAIAAALGVVESGRLTDTYNLANTAPNIIYELALGGILTSVFVPLFVELLEKEGRERAWQVASAIINVSLAVLVALSAIVIVAAPWIAKFYSAAGSEQEAALTFLLRLFIPQIIFYGLTAITSGLLNAHKRFGAPMYTPILNNLAVVAVFLAFKAAYESVSLDDITNSQLLIIGLGTTTGVALMAIAQIPFLRGLGKYQLTFSMKHPSLRKLARLSVFVIGYVAVNQLGYLVVQYLAKENVGAYTAYTWAFIFFILPHGLFSVSIITALLPGMSEHAVNQRWDEFRQRLSIGIRSTVLLILPAAIGFFVLGEPIVRFLLERGVMTARSTDLIADVLRFFVIGLVPFSIFQLMLRAFYAMQDTRTPFVINTAAVVLNTIFNLLVFDSLGVKGLALGHALAYIFGALVQARVLGRRIGGLDSGRILNSAARISVAAAAMGAVVYAVSRAIETGIEPDGSIEEALAIAVPVVAGLGTYLLLGRILRISELDQVWGLLRRRVGR